MKFKTLLALSLVCAVDGSVCSVATAQTLIAPPASQESFTPATPLPPSPNAAAANGSGQNTLEIPVPMAFTGCWMGLQSGSPDSFQSSGLRISHWIPSEIMLCLRKNGAGPWQLTLSKKKLDTSYAAKNRHPVSNLHTRTEIVSSDGKNQVWLRSVYSVDEQATFSWLFAGPNITISAVSDDHCTLDGAIMNFQSSELDYYSGLPLEHGKTPWTRTTRHLQLRRLPDATDSRDQSP